MKKGLKELVLCPICNNTLGSLEDDQWVCSNCGKTIKVANGIPLFTDVPQTIKPWEKVDRGPDQGTAWRKSNWRFLESIAADQAPDAKILDVGAGHGDFSEIFNKHEYYALDIVPYPEVDLVTDLGQVNPFKQESFDLILLMNVLEHDFESRELLKTIGKILKPGGRIAITVPFLLKVHQEPYDFYRYTPYALEKMAGLAGLKVESLQGYYDTQYLLNESLGNVWQYSINTESRLKQIMAKSLIFFTQRFINLLGGVTRKGFTAQTVSQQNPAPVGYLVVLRK